MGHRWIGRATLALASAILVTWSFATPVALGAKHPTAGETAPPSGNDGVVVATDEAEAAPSDDAQSGAASSSPDASADSLPPESRSSPEQKPIRLAEPPIEVVEEAPGARGAARDDAAPEATADEAQPAPDAPLKVEVDAAQFNGVVPGVTTLEQLEAAWGAPHERAQAEGREQSIYHIEPFREVVVTLDQGKVTMILINLARAFGAGELAKELSLTAIRPVAVRDEFGESLGQVYPERGVAFSFAPGAKPQQVFQIVLDTIDLQAFLLRAETNVHRGYRASLADLDFVVGRDPQLARAHWLRAELLSDLGRFPEALRAAEEAVRLDEQSLEYRLTRARLLDATGDYERAVAETEEVLGPAEKLPAIKALAWAQLGDLLAAGPDRDYQRAVELHQRAIDLAEPLAAERRVAARELALRILLKSHLAVARDIAWGPWNKKPTVVPKWLARASQFAEQVDAAEGSDGAARFLVAKEGLAACVGLQGELDPSTWTEAALKHGRQLIAHADDALVRQRWEWELGVALYDTLQVFHMRRQHQPAMKYGSLAVSYLERADAQREHFPGHAYMMGRLYFRLGSIQAIQYRDHQRAIPWFEKAIPLIEEPIPLSAMADIGRQGETFISMGVSYWETEQYDEALRLTAEGLRLMEQAVNDGILDRRALGIPYSNLASMHHQLGDDLEADKFADLAARVESSKTR